MDGIVHISNSESNAGVLLVPDSVDMSDCDFWYDIYSANYNTTDQTEVDALNEYYSDANFYKLQEAKTEAVLGEDGSYYSMNCETSKRLRDNSVGLTAMIVFIGIYLGVVFLISGAAILSLKELSEAADSKENTESCAGSAWTRRKSVIPSWHSRACSLLCRFYSQSCIPSSECRQQCLF